jgi:hypothetical protein
MQFSLATLAVLATAVMAETTLFVTEEVTITSCAPTVTNCPARSTVVSLTTYPVITGTAAPTPVTYTRFTTIVNTITSCAPTVTNCPYGSLTSTVIPITSTIAPPTNGTIYTAPAPKPTASVSNPAPVVPATSVPAPSVVTVTVNYCPAPTSLVAVPVKPSTTAPAVPVVPVVPSGSVPVVPSVSASPSKPANGTAVTTTTPPKFTGAAATMSGSLGAVAVAGLIAVFFA